MKLSLRRNGVEIGQTYAGLSIGVDGVFVSPATPGWSLTVPEDSEFPLPGLYDFVEIIEPELEQTPEDIRAAMPTLSPPQIRLLLIHVLGIQPEPDSDDLFDLLKARLTAVFDGIADPMLKARAKIYWETATYFERLNPLIDQIGALLGLTPEQIDAAWMNFVGAEA